MVFFQDTKYFLASSLPLSRQEQLELSLTKNGATKADSVLNATHIVTNSPYFAGCESIPDTDVAIVSDLWVDRCLVLGKIQPPQYYSVDPGMIFSGVVACAAELPTHDLEVLSAGISALGGQWRIALTNDVTHLFAVSRNSTKYASAMLHRDTTSIHILLPHWFDDSVRLGIHNLPVDPYLWPDPPLLKEIGVVIKEENKPKTEMIATANKFTPALDSSRVPLPKDVDLIQVKKNAWNGKKILLSWTLSLYGSRREAVEAGIRRAGGVVLRHPGDDDDDLGTDEKEKRRDKKESRTVVECDILITRWRSGRAYGKAFRLHKTIGTLAWLYHVQSTGLNPRPVDQLLHYPVPRRPIENFSKHEITVTNYTGEAREYIKRLISTMGASFTPSMSGRNTVLIAAYISGQKAEKARAWSIPIVNHTWLEDCFIQWRHLTTAIEKYITFPPGMDFSRVLGERGVGIRGVELCDEEEMKEYGSDDADSDVDVMMKTEVVEEGEEEEEDIDMISMPDPEEDKVAILNYVSPKKEKRRDISESVTPGKRNGRTPNKAAIVTPARQKSKSVSPNKKRRIVVDEDDEGAKDDDDDDDDDDIVRRMKAIRSRKPVSSNADDSEPVRPITPSKKSKSTTKFVTPAKKPKPSTVDLDLSDEDDEQLDKTPEFYKDKSKPNDRVSPKKATVSVEITTPRSAKKTKKNVTPGKKEVTKVVSSGEESPVAPKSKQRLVRRSTNESNSNSQTTSQEQEKKDDPGSSTTRRLVRRASGRPTINETDFERQQEKENLATSAVVPPEPVKELQPKTSLLKLRTGDARTRVKAKNANANAKTRELVYSDSENEVVDHIVGPSEGKAKKGNKGKGVPKKKDRKSKPVPSEEESAFVESEDEDAEEVPNPKVSPLARKVSVVVNPPPHAMKSTPRNKGKKKATDDGDGSLSEGDHSDEDPKRNSSARQIKKNESIRVEAGEKAVSSKSRPSPIKTTYASKSKSRSKPKLRISSPPARVRDSSPLSAISNTNTPYTDLSEPPAKRGAAAKAEAKLKEMMPDATKYEQEVKKARKSGGWSNMWGREDREGQKEEAKVKDEEERKKKKRASDAVSGDELEEPKRKRRRSSTSTKKKGKVVEEEESGQSEEEQVEVTKKGRGKSETSAKVYLMTTQVILPADTIRGLEKLGVVLTSKPLQCTHFLAPSLVRTEKLLCALAAAPFILDSSWAIKSANQKQLLPVDKFALTDATAESKYRMKLSETLARAKQLKGTLLAEKTFYLTPKVGVEYKLLKTVVTAHGGQLVQQSPTVRLITGHPNRHVISCPEDISIWRPLSAQDIPIFTHEFLLIGVLRQELEWDNRTFRVSGSFNT